MLKKEGNIISILTGVIILLINFPVKLCFKCEFRWIFELNFKLKKKTMKKKKTRFFLIFE